MNGSSFSGVLNDEIDLYSETIEIRRSILCIICLGTYFNPVRLPCSHTFCGHCILEASRVKLRCPICSAEFSKRSINRVPNLSKVIGDIDALVKSLTADNRFSIPTEKLDEQYRERQRAVRLENQHVQSTSSSSLQTVIFKQRKFSSESCRSINVDVDTTSSSSVKLTIGALLELPSSTSDDVAHAHGIKILPCQQNSDLSPQRLSDILCRSQSPQVELAASDLHSVNGSEDTNSSPRIQPDAISSLSRRVTQEEAAERSLSVTKSVLPSSSIKTTNPVGIVPAIQLPESATITAQVASSNSSRTDEITANFRPGEVVEVTARMWPG